MRVLVVDDEPIMRNAYSSIIEWDKNGFTLVGNAHNGMLALEFMRANPVDIVITDLKMPVMSGLELIKRASAEFPDVRFIVMSGFDEFHMVKEAYELGVKEYFLKIELDPDAILKTLFKIKKEIEDEKMSLAENDGNGKNNTSGSNSALNFEQRSRTILCEELLKKLIWGADAKTAERQLGKHEIYLQENDLVIMGLSLPDYYSAEEKFWEGEREIFKYAILNVLEEICRRYKSLYVFCNLPNEFIVVCNVPDRKDTRLRDFFNDVRSAIHTCFGLDIDCGLSSVVNRYTDLKNAYREAIDACKYSFVTGHGKFNSYKEIRYVGNNIDVAKGVQAIKQLLMYIEPEKIRNNAFKLRISPNSVGVGQVEKVKNLFYSYYIEMTNFIEENGLENELLDSINIYDSIKESADLSMMNEWLIKSIFNIADSLFYRTGIYKVINYIKNHYSEQINLKILADMLGVSEPHLSRTFHKKFGMSFTQYLLKMRMDIAAQLLQNENYKIYEVAEKVGYTNSEQFSRMFKKVMGKSPKEFQK